MNPAPRSAEHHPANENWDHVPMWLRVRWFVPGRVRRLWQMLPAKWMPLAYRFIRGVAMCLPAPLRSNVRNVVGRLRAESLAMEQDYANWIRLYEQTGAKDRRAAMVKIAGFADPPLISMFMPVLNPPVDHLRAAIQSVRDQFYQKWELCIIDDAMTDPSVARFLRTEQARDARVKVLRRDTDARTAAAPDAVLNLAGGSFIATLDQDGLLSPHALYEVVARIVVQPGADIVYSDEDRVDDAGRRSTPYFKPDWNPELMLGQNLIEHFGVYRRALVQRIGGFHASPKACQRYDLALRLVEATEPDAILHVPKVLYHARDHTASAVARERSEIDNRRVVRDFLSRGSSGIQVQAASTFSGWTHMIYPIPKPEPLVSVIIPSRNHADMLERALQGLLNRTDYPALEVLIVDNGSDEPTAVALLERMAHDRRVRVLRCPGPFNYSALNNRAAGEANGSLLLLLNNDIDVIHPEWLREMVSHAIRPGIGAVGAKLLYPDGTIQHGGVTLGMFGLADHQYLKKPCGDPGYFGQLKLARNVAAVTGACLMICRKKFQEVGGLNEESLAVAFNDVDFCLKLLERGYRNMWTPHAELYHLESASRGVDHTAKKALRLKREIAYMRQRWGHLLDRDPYWNPNLSLHSTDIALAFPPRDTRCTEAKAA